MDGKMSRRAAAARFGASLSSAIKWVQRFERTARVEPRDWAL
jgi:transposase